MSDLHESVFQGHPFHLISHFPLPIFTSISLLFIFVLLSLPRHK